MPKDLNLGGGVQVSITGINMVKPDYGDNDKTNKETV